MDWVFSRQFTNPALAPIFSFAFEIGDSEEGGTRPNYGTQFPKIERELVIGVMELLKFAAGWKHPTCCYVITAAYGSRFHPDVQFAIQLRERELAQTLTGRRFLAAIDCVYERIGPSIARFLEPRATLRGIVRRGAAEPLLFAIRLCERLTRGLEPRGRRVAAFVALLSVLICAAVIGVLALLALSVWAVMHA
jgi:hypothetical protein